MGAGIYPQSTASVMGSRNVITNKKDFKQLCTYSVHITKDDLVLMNISQEIIF